MSSPDHEVLRFVASECVPDVLHDIASTPGLGLVEALDRWSEPSRAPFLMDTFTRLNLVTTPDMQVTTRGRACSCGVSVIEGSSIVDVIDRLRQLDPSSNRITLVREGMTSEFIQLLQRLDTIRRVMICSPWTSLNRDRLQSLATGIERSKRRSGFSPEVSVVTRPVEEQPDGRNNETLAYLQRIGIVTFTPQLHSKLYIVESGTMPAQRHAFVGSENFTKVRYQEVGIRVSNDNQVIDDLIHYFLSLAQ